MATLSIDDRIKLVADSPRQLYLQVHKGRDLSEALELVLSEERDGIVPNFYTYNWSERKREGETPIFERSEPINDGQNIPLSEIYQRLLHALIGRGCFVEEKDANSILLQPLTTSVDYINERVDSFISYLKAQKSPVLERPQVINTEEGYRNWLMSYHEINGMELPGGFHNKNEKQLRGMFMGITAPERIEERVRERQFVVEFYKAHYAMLPIGFENWGYKQVELLYDKLNRRYGKGNPQGELFKI